MRVCLFPGQTSVHDCYPPGGGTSVHRSSAELEVSVGLQRGLEPSERAEWKECAGRGLSPGEMGPRGHCLAVLGARPSWPLSSHQTLRSGWHHSLYPLFSHQRPWKRHSDQGLGQREQGPWVVAAHVALPAPPTLTSAFCRAHVTS